MENLREMDDFSTSIFGEIIILANNYYGKNKNKGFSWFIIWLVRTGI